MVVILRVDSTVIFRLLLLTIDTSRGSIVVLSAAGQLTELASDQLSQVFTSKLIIARRT